jgi:DNA polymerase-3 subunit alpha
LPRGFSDQDKYLRHLAYEGARKRYGDLTGVVNERLEFELGIIISKGYSGYFLIVQDFINVARKQGVVVGPGRGSAAGSLVAYCLSITAIDPLKYNLLFERFLNPERLSMPDIDIDFDDEGRSKVIDYVKKKYGENHVAQIITYGTMKAKMAIRDVGRVLDIPLNVVDKVAKSFPSHLSATLTAILSKDDIDKDLKPHLSSEDTEKAYNMRKMAEGDDDISRLLKIATNLEGSVRNTGVHACGVVITPEEVSEYVPIATAKEADTVITQFDNSVAEKAGLLKMDFLGLKTLSIIRDAVELIKINKRIKIDIDNVDLTDEKTYQLFQRGETTGIFQYESPGMKKHMIDLVPNVFEDLIAMNALYRPGPMKYIPDFIQRKHGKQEIKYDLPEMEEILAETYGITVYQEQVMLLSQKLAGFSRGKADSLRKGMGKKVMEELEKIHPEFINGCKKNGHPDHSIDKIWKDWLSFASYAFNKSHSTCYAYIGFQTAYLKANYPAEFMASVLNHNKKDLTKLNFFLSECKRMDIGVLGPDINESGMDFTVNKKDQIRFGLSALKGVGEAPIAELLAEREKNGNFEDIYDLVKRVDSNAVTKKCYESLVLGGALDSTGNKNRAAFFNKSGKFDTFIEDLIRYGQIVKKHSSGIQQTLFGDISNVLVDKPPMPETEPWNVIEMLEREKEVTGIYVTSHPLEQFEFEIDNYTTHRFSDVNLIKDVTMKMAGIVTDDFHGVNRRGIPYGKFTVQDFDSTLEFMLSNEGYQKFGSYLKKGQVVYIQGINQKSYSSDNFFFKVLDVRLLDTIGKALTKSITLHIPSAKIDVELIKNLSALCKKHKGKHKLLAVLYDNGRENKLTTVSKTIRVNVSNEFVLKLKKMGIHYNIN